MRFLHEKQKEGDRRDGRKEGKEEKGRPSSSTSTSAKQRPILSGLPILPLSQRCTQIEIFINLNIIVNINIIVW